MLLSDVAADGFRWLSRLRGRRVFHPEGVAFRGTWRTEERGPLAGMARADLEAVVRLSRGVGLPAGLPDVLGLAIKVLDAGGPGQDLDLLLARSGSGAFGRRVLVPARDFTGGTFSSLLPYAAVDGSQGPVTAVIRHDGVGQDSTRFDALRRSSDAPLTISLAIGDGPPAARVEVSAALDDAIARDLRFDPSHDAGPLRPTGFLNRLRRPVYAASQDGRGAPERGARPRL